MNRLFLIFMQLFQCADVFSFDAAAVNMELDETNTVRTIGPEMDGINMEWDVGIQDYCQIQEENGQVAMNKTPCSSSMRRDPPANGI